MRGSDLVILGGCSFENRIVSFIDLFTQPAADETPKLLAWYTVVSFESQNVSQLYFPQL